MSTRAEEFKPGNDAIKAVDSPVSNIDFTEWLTVIRTDNDAIGAPSAALSEFPNADTLLQNFTAHAADEKVQEAQPEPEASGSKEIKDVDRPEPPPTRIPSRFEKYMIAIGEFNSQISADLSDKDRTTMKDLGLALLNGFDGAFARAIERFRNDPTALKNFMDDLNRTLLRAGVTNLRAQTNGETVTISGAGNRTVDISTDRRVTVREDGKPVPGVSVYDTLKAMGKNAIGDINRSVNARDSWN